MLKHFFFGGGLGGGSILQTILPYAQQAKNDPDVSFHVTALSNIYVERLGRNTTQIYLNEFKDLASRSGENFEDVLKGMLAHMHDMVVPKHILNSFLLKLMTLHLFI